MPAVDAVAVVVVPFVVVDAEAAATKCQEKNRVGSVQFRY